MSLRTLSLTIPAGHSMSSGVDCSGSIRILRIVMPSVWDAAPLTFQTSVDGVTYNNLHLAAPVGDFTTYPATIPIVTPGAAITMPPDTGYGISWLRFRSGTFTTQIKQSQDATFQVVLEMPDAVAGGGTGAGPAGPTGPAGIMGSTGPAGATGPVGPIGMSGAIGTQGATGAAGSAGPAGPQGPTGLPGGTGAPGIAGPAGVQGVAGPTGPTGTMNYAGTILGDNAAPGIVGEQMAASQATAIQLTTGVTVNVASLALTPGDWSCSGVIVFDATTNTLPTMLAAAASSVSAVLPTVAQVVAGTANMTQYFLPFAKSADHIMQTGIFRMNISAPATVYLVAQAAFSGGTLAVTGYISARRVR